VLGHDGSAIDDQIEGLSKYLVDLLGVAIEAFIGFCNARGDDGVPQLCHQGQGDGISRDPDTNGLLVCQHDLGHQLGGLQDKGIRARDRGSHNARGVIGDMGIVADVLKVCADDAEALILAVFLKVMNPFYGVFLIEIAPKAIDSIGGIGDNPAFPENLHHLADEPWLRIFLIYFDNHGSVPPFK
jgi:hypothetical protein